MAHLGITDMLEKLFGLKAASSNIRTEILAGISTFLTMSFIIAVNPMFLADAGIPFEAGFVATIIATTVGTAIMAFWAKWTVAVAPGMGLNAYFAYGLVLGQQFFRWSSQYQIVGIHHRYDGIGRNAIKVIQEQGLLGGKSFPRHAQSQNLVLVPPLSRRRFPIVEKRIAGGSNANDLDGHLILQVGWKRFGWVLPRKKNMH